MRVVYAGLVPSVGTLRRYLRRVWRSPRLFIYLNVVMMAQSRCTLDKLEFGLTVAHQTLVLNGSADVFHSRQAGTHRCGLIGHVVNILIMAAEMMRVLTAKLEFNSVVELIGHAEVSGEECASNDGSLLHMLSTCLDVSRAFEVVIGGTRMESGFCIFGGTHMESRFCRFVFCGVHSSGRVWCILSCVRLSGCCLCGHLRWGDRLSTPQVLRLLLHEPRLLRRKRDCTPALFFTSSVCSPAISLCSSEEEGLAPLPSSSQCRGVLRRRRDRPTSSHIRRVLRRGRDRPSASQ